MDQGTRTLLELLERAGIPHSLHKVIPFIGEIVPDANPEGPVIVIGSYSLRHVAREKGWWPGSFDLADITTADCIAHWGQHMLNADAVTCRFEDVLPHLDRAGDKFIRPTVDSKFFAGGVFDYDEFVEWWEKVVVLEEDTGSTLTKDTEVIVASPKAIQTEYRTWVIDGNVATASLYKRGGSGALRWQRGCGDHRLRPGSGRRVVAEAGVRA